MLESLARMSLFDFLALALAGLFGLVWHYVAKVVELRKAQQSVTIRGYFVNHIPETAGAVMTLAAGTWGLIELGEASVLSVALLGYTIDSHANKFRARGQGLL